MMFFGLVVCHHSPPPPPPEDFLGTPLIVSLTLFHQSALNHKLTSKVTLPKAQKLTFNANAHYVVSLSKCPSA